MSDERLQLRAADYKSAWVNALSVDLKENAELTRLMSILSDELDDQRDAVLDIVQLMPQLLISIEDRLKTSTDKLLTKIEQTGERVQAGIELSAATLIKSQADFLAEFAVERQELIKMRAVLDTQRADIEQARIALNEARAGFNQMGLLKRIFIRR